MRDPRDNILPATVRDLRLGALSLLPVYFRLSGHAIRVRAVEPNPFGATGLAELGADDVPALPEMHHAVVELSRPALGRDAHPVGLSHELSLNPSGRDRQV